MSMMIYSTIGTVEDAKKIARALVEEQVVACVNIIPKVISIYRWKGTVEEDDEVILIAKTTDNNVELAIHKIQELHPYEVPDIIALPVVNGLKKYLQYIEDETL